MASVTCPNCGYRQEGGTKCLKCATLFSYHTPSARTVSVAPTRVTAPGPAKPRPGALRRGIQIFKWAALAILVVTLVMILRHSPPPNVSADPQAPARVETKLQAAATAAQSGQPHELRLDAAELNTFLQQNLVLNNDTHAEAGSPAPSSPETDPTLAEAQSSVRDVKIAMSGNRIEAYLTFDFLGKDLSLDLEGRVYTQGGFVRFEPTGGKLGTFPLPQSALQEAVSRMMDSPENRDKFRLPPDVRDIRIENGELVVTYR